MDMLKTITSNVEKMIVNVGVGKMRQNTQFDEKILPEIAREVALITGQKPLFRPAKKSIAGFKLREGDVVGVKITLRGKRMSDFLMRLITIVLPRVRDFRGLSIDSVDGSGNLHIGFKEQSVFPEIDMDKSKVSFGLQVSIVPKTKKKEQAIDFYKLIGVPLKS